MRLKPEILHVMKQLGKEIIPEATVYLFGSRTSDEKRGGDIDLMVLSKEKIENKRIREFKISCYKKMGWQKIDVIHYTQKESSVFKQIISKEAVLLW